MSLRDETVYVPLDRNVADRAAWRTDWRTFNAGALGRISLGSVIMLHDENHDPTNPLGTVFQDRVLKRGKHLEQLRVAARSDPKAASLFEKLAVEQLTDYDQLVQATERFPVGEIRSPVAIFRSAMEREIQQLREDVKRLRSQGK